MKTYNKQKPKALPKVQEQKKKAKTATPGDAKDGAQAAPVQPAKAAPPSEESLPSPATPPGEAASANVRGDTANSSYAKLHQDVEDLEDVGFASPEEKQVWNEVFGNTGREPAPSRLERDLGDVIEEETAKIFSESQAVTATSANTQAIVPCNKDVVDVPDSEETLVQPDIEETSILESIREHKEKRTWEEYRTKERSEAREKRLAWQDECKAMQGSASGGRKRWPAGTAVIPGPPSKSRRTTTVTASKPRPIPKTRAKAKAKAKAQAKAKATAQTKAAGSQGGETAEMESAAY